MSALAGGPAALADTAFERKKDADERHAAVRVNVRATWMQHDG